MIAGNQLNYQPPAVAPCELSSPKVVGLINQIATERKPRVERRKISRAKYRTQAWLQPADEAGALRPPVIFTRDLDPMGLGFIAKNDLSVLGTSILHLPSASGRTVRLTCRVRRALEFCKGWYEGFVEFNQPHEIFAVNRTRPS